jgi:cytochrome c oxidase subunit 3
MTARASWTGLYALLGAATMFFAALTSAMIVRRGLGDDWRGIPLPALVWVNTAILIASTAALERGSRRAAIALGAAFLAGQVFVWTSVAIAASPGDSFFVVFTGGHAAHVLGGLGALQWARVALARVYWHFLTGLWICLLVLFAVWGNR